MVKSTAAHRNGKPAKPYPDFPLFPHATRRWAKKIRGKIHYFGPWDEADAALQKYLDQKNDLHAGRKPRVSSDTLTVRDLVNRFLTTKRLLVDSGELAARTFGDYYGTCERVVAAFGRDRPVDDLAGDDFEQLRAALAKKWGPVPLGNEVQRVRSLFKYAADEGLIDRPVRFGTSFRKPSKKVIRLERAKKGPCMFTPAELKMILNAASVLLRAMILLGINVGFGNHDCALLPLTALDLAGGWVNYPRPKTGVPRRAKLWPETVDAIREAITHRPAPKNGADDGLVFITKYGTRWSKDSDFGIISKEMAKLLKALGMHRAGLNFYALRHTIETVGGESRDQVAVDAIMGHARDDMASIYRERVSDERLRAVAKHVRQWVFGEKTKPLRHCREDSPSAVQRRQYGPKPR